MPNRLKNRRCHLPGVIMKGRTIRIDLVDGVPTGILTAEIINWTGKVIVAPRSGQVQASSNSPHRSQQGGRSH